MPFISLQEPVPENHLAVFDIGFRALFLSASFYSLIALALWGLLYFFGWGTSALNISPMVWHAHEMIFGFSLAVIAGFLLTAVQNWTGLTTLKGRSLQLLLIIWLLGRAGFWLLDHVPMIILALVDNLFTVYLIAAVARPIIRVKQWRQSPILLILVLFLACNSAFYAGLGGLLSNGIHLGLYGGLYLILLLILIISRRVFPMFITNGVADIQPGVVLTNRTWLELAIMVLFIAFALLELFANEKMLSAGLALLLGVFNCLRLAGWHTPAIWKKPLLWVLYVSHIWLITGFFLVAASTVFTYSPYLALHAFTVGGIGMITLGMMSRVSLGHTGRNVFQPPFNLNPLFMTLLAAVIFRVLFPLIWAEHYLIWTGLSIGFWVLAFSLFLWRYTKILMQPRVSAPGKS